MWSNSATTQSINVSTSGNYSVTVTYGNGCSTTSASTTVTVNQFPDITTNLNGIVISSNQNGAAYQWLDCNNGNLPIAGATNQSYTAAINGDYAVLVTLNSCSDTSACVNISVVGIDAAANNNQFVIYPNPTTGKFTIQMDNGQLSINNYQLSIYNVYGEKVYEDTPSLKGVNAFSVSLPSGLGQGIYFLQLKTSEGIAVKKIMISK